MLPFPPPFEAVLFDLDGVLIDTTDLHYRLWSEFATRHGYTPSAKELVATNGCRAEETIRNWLGHDLPAEVVEELIIEREWHASRALETEAFSAVRGAREFVRSLQHAGHPIAVATSAVPENARLSLERIGLADMFEVVVTAMDVQRGKPHPDCYLEAAKRLNVKPENCLVIEDSLMGIRAGKASGAQVLALATTFPRETLVELEPSWIAKDFCDLPEWHALEPIAAAG
ncbi:HAD family hydrolase [Aeoliella sp. SH292]|uniref:HAD family hydrolase n=1 Tax=Aeoliella sp. SH292 TaxID=3454464 RepID=UPI003F9A76F5